MFVQCRSVNLLSEQDPNRLAAHRIGALGDRHEVHRIWLHLKDRLTRVLELNFYRVDVLLAGDFANIPSMQIEAVLDRDVEGISLDDHMENTGEAACRVP